jgi:hypothetical protein
MYSVLSISYTSVHKTKVNKKLKTQVISDGMLCHWASNYDILQALKTFKRLGISRPTTEHHIQERTESSTTPLSQHQISETRSCGKNGDA